LQNDPICVIGAGSDEIGEAVQNGGSVRGYHEFLTSLAA
jgi:hypothetical protein